jgi:hypothetical protein
MLTEGRNRSAAVLIAWLMTSTLLSAKNEGGRPGIRYYHIPSGLVLFMCSNTTNEELAAARSERPSFPQMSRENTSKQTSATRAEARDLNHTCVRILLYLSAYYYICALVLLCMCRTPLTRPLSFFFFDEALTRLLSFFLFDEASLLFFFGEACL